MSGNVKVKDSPRFDLHDDEHIDELERCRYNDKEVTGDDSYGMVAQERHPPLGRINWARWILRHVGAKALRPSRQLLTGVPCHF
jgi:hypothetical protein